MLRLHQGDGLSQRRPLSSDQPIVQFCQESLLGAAQILYVLAEGGCTHTPTVLAAVTQDGALVTGVGACGDPLVEAARPGGGKGRDVPEEAKPTHFMTNVGHLVEENRV